MGDLIVRCDCYKKGFTKLAPFQKDIIETPYGLTLPDGQLSDHDIYNKFEKWMVEEACIHNFMVFYTKTYEDPFFPQGFNFSMAQLGAERYPILNQYPLTKRKTYIPFETVKELQKELHKLEKENNKVKLKVLKEAQTNTKVYSTINGIPKVYGWMNNLQNAFAVNQSGLQVIKTENFMLKKPEVIFVSTDFDQVKIEENQYLLKDRATGKEIIVENSVSQDSDSPFDGNYSFVVEDIQVPFVEEHGYFIKILQESVNASLQTGNPIIMAPTVTF